MNLVVGTVIFGILLCVYCCLWVGSDEDERMGYD